MKTSGYIITGGVVGNVSAAVDVDVDAVVVILRGAIVGDNDDSPALSLDRASLDADFTKSTSSCCDVVVFAVVDMDGVGGGNGKFTFLINSRLSEPLFIAAESTTAALCPGFWMSARGLFGDDVVVGLINPDPDDGGSVVKIGNVPSCLLWTDSSRSQVTC